MNQVLQLTAWLHSAEHSVLSGPCDSALFFYRLASRLLSTTTALRALKKVYVQYRSTDLLLPKADTYLVCSEEMKAEVYLWWGNVWQILLVPDHSLSFCHVWNRPLVCRQFPDGKQPPTLSHTYSRLILTSFSWGLATSLFFPSRSYSIVSMWKALQRYGTWTHSVDLVCLFWIDWAFFLAW